MVDAPTRPQPEQLTPRQLRALSRAALAAYNQQRRAWHAILGPLKPP